jgi:hypothetical protein
MADDVMIFCGSILDGIAGNAAITAWISTNYSGGTMEKYLGLDVSNLPDDVLWCSTVPQNIGMTDTYNSRSNGILVTVSLMKEGTTSATNYSKLTGLDLIVDLANLIQSQVETTLSDNILNLSEISIDLDYPYFRASFNLTIPTAV